MVSSKRVALFLHDLQNDYQQILRTDCERAAQRNQMELVVRSADRDADVQLRQIRRVLAEPGGTRPHALVVSCVWELPLLNLAREAAALGIAWVFLTRWNDAIHDLRRGNPKVPIFAVLGDQLEIGRIQGRQLRMLIEPQAEVVYLRGPSGTYSARCREQGFDQEIAGHCANRRVNLNGDWSQSGGYSAAKRWLSTLPRRKLPDVVVVSQNDNMAAGVREALVEWCGHDPEVDMLGCDGSPGLGQMLVRTGRLRGTVVVPSVSGRALDELALAFRLGQMPPAEIKLPVRSYPDLYELRRSPRQNQPLASR